MKLKIIYPRATKSAFLYQAFCKLWEFGVSKAKMDKYSPWLQSIQPVSWIQFIILGVIYP